MNGKTHREIKRLSKICITIIFAATIMTLYHIENISKYYFDAGDYWGRGQALWSNGEFSFLHMADGFRGYIYPLYLGICGKAGEYGFVVINSFLVSFWFVYCMPSLHMCHERGKTILRENVECVFAFFLFLLFFRGLVLYPLSDFFAIMLCSFSVLLELEIEKMVGRKGIAASFLLGTTLYLAYNVRTIYVFAGIWVFGKLLLYLLCSTLKLADRIHTLLFTVVGILVAAIPQVYINYILLNKNSLAVPTNGLMLKQVSWGIRYQRYDTFVGNSLLHTNPQMYFVDPVGNALMENMGIKEFAGWGEFLKVAFLHPLDFLGIYVRHIVNMMFPCWPQQYVANLNNHKTVYAVTAILVFFLFGTALMHHFLNQEVLKRYAALVFPVLFILAGAVEVRFFAAVYLLAIGGVCFNIDWGGGWKYLLDNKGKVFASLVLFGGVLISQWSSMLASESVSVIFL